MMFFLSELKLSLRRQLWPDFSYGQGYNKVKCSTYKNTITDGGSTTTHSNAMIIKVNWTDCILLTKLVQVHLACKYHHQHQDNHPHRQKAAEICGQHGAIVPRVDARPTGRALRDSLAIFYRLNIQNILFLDIH